MDGTKSIEGELMLNLLRRLPAGAQSWFGFEGRIHCRVMALTAVDACLATFCIGVESS